jgi:hypothetical protein
MNRRIRPKPLIDYNMFKNYGLNKGHGFLVIKQI